MTVMLTNSERQHLRQLQKQRRDEDGYVKVTVILLLDKRRPLASVADDLGLDETTVYRYARAFTPLGVDQYLVHEQPGYWDLFTTAPNSPTCAERSTRRATATVAPCRRGCCARTGWPTRSRA